MNSSENLGPGGYPRAESRTQFVIESDTYPLEMRYFSDSRAARCAADSSRSGAIRVMKVFLILDPPRRSVLSTPKEPVEAASDKTISRRHR